MADLDALKAQRGPMVGKLAAASLQEIVADPQLLEFARAQGRPAFAENCAPCHGAGGGGAKGYPNLNDDEWIWGGKLDEIAQTIRHGIRSGDRSAARARPCRPSAATACSSAPTSRPSPTTCARSRGLAPDRKADLAAGKKLFADNCAVCHGEAGKGNRDLGAPEPDRPDLALRLRQGHDRRRRSGTGAAA